MFRLLAKRIIITLVSMLFITCTVIQIGAQDSTGFQGRLAYERRVDEDTVEVVYHENGTHNIFPITATECYKVFTENGEIQSRFMVISQRENPVSLAVYDMFSTNLVFEREWEASWGSCSFHWIEDYIAVWIRDDTLPDYFDFVRLDLTGDILDTVSRERGRSHWEETNGLLAEWIPDYPSGNSWYEEDYPYRDSQYSPYIIISVWLDDTLNIVQRESTSRQTIILNVAEGSIIEVLENAPIIEPDPRFLSGVHLQDFEFSSTGETLFYVSRYAMIYDIVEGEYPVQIELDTSYSTTDVTRSIRWSPDGEYVSFTLLATNENALGKFIAAIDVADGELYVSTSRYDENSHAVLNRIWLSGQFALAWISPDQELIIFDVKTDTTHVIDNNVTRIIGS